LSALRVSVERDAVDHQRVAEQVDVLARVASQRPVVAGSLPKRFVVPRETA
jgi:hypothetical protein